METEDFEAYKQHAYELFCRKIIINKAINIHKKLDRDEARVVILEDATDGNPFETLSSLACEDSYDLAIPVLVRINGEFKLIKDHVLGNALRSLLPHYRDPVYFSVIAQYKDSEISHILNVPLRTVNYRKNKGLKKLRELIGDNYELF